MTTPTLINLPPPPSDPVTPSDMGPGTPNSGLSALSTTAIKDGHQGAPFPHGRHTHQSSSASSTSTTTLEAERADRISRLAGLERVATARAGGQSPINAVTPTSHGPGYFDSPATLKERSTVGSASATGSIGGHTTWASGSDAFEDKMSEDHDHDDTFSSVSNVSDEGNASLVGFGEGANSTISGPTSRPPGLNRLSSGGHGRPTSMGSNMSRPTPLSSYLAQQAQQVQVPPVQVDSAMMSASPAGSNTPEPMSEDARMVDGMTFDNDVVDTTVRTPRFASPSNRSGSGFGTPARE